MDAILRALESMGRSDDCVFLVRALHDAPTGDEVDRVLDIEARAART